MAPPLTDLTGRRFGRLIARRPAGEKTKDGRTIWLCECNCGQYAKVNVSSLLSGDTRSCGCLRREVGRAQLAAARAARHAR
jgi:hypothetical protein